MKVDYSKGKIYKITNDYNDDVYVGSTCDTLVKRFSLHKIESTNERSKHRKIYNAFNEIGFERFRIELLEDYPCEDIYQLRQREGYYIRQIGTLNKVISGRTDNEYKEDNKELIKERNKHYREDNKELIKERNKNYIENNKEVIKERKKKYYDANREKILNEKGTKILCECGCSVTHIARHRKSKNHDLLMSQKSST